MPVGFSLWQLVNKNIWGQHICDMMTCNGMYKHQLFGDILFPCNENKMMLGLLHHSSAGGTLQIQVVLLFSPRGCTDRLNTLLITYLCTRVMHQNGRDVRLSLSYLDLFPHVNCVSIKDKFWLYWSRWKVFHWLQGDQELAARGQGRTLLPPDAVLKPRCCQTPSRVLPPMATLLVASVTQAWPSCGCAERKVSSLICLESITGKGKKNDSSCDNYQGKQCQLLFT